MRNYYKKFRGEPGLIRERQLVFMPYFRGRRKVLDLGCGHGGFLVLLKESGVPAVGVDSDPEAVATCKTASLDVTQGDIFEFLGRSSGYDGIMASHVIEHMDIETAERLVDGCYAAMVSGGTLTIITPNPENLTAITKTFWLDPTHIRPYPVELLVELLRDTGFEIVASGASNASRPQGFKAGVKRALGGSVLKLFGLGQLRTHLFSGHDIFVVGRKP